MFNKLDLPNLGVITTVLPDDLYDIVMEEVNEIQSDFDNYKDWNEGLAGNIERQYPLVKCLPYMQKFLSFLCTEYSKGWNYYPKNGEYYFETDNLWVNYQKKNEFNPIHHHGGAFSFVCWLKIPYTLEDELNAPHVKGSKNKKASTFQFLYTNTLGNITQETLYVDKDWEKRLMVFPAHLSHCVYPFSTSDDYRISISGNLI